MFVCVFAKSIFSHIVPLKVIFFCQMAMNSKILEQSFEKISFQTVLHFSVSFTGISFRFLFYRNTISFVWRSLWYSFVIQLQRGYFFPPILICDGRTIKYLFVCLNTKRDLHSYYYLPNYYTSTKSWRGYIFTSVCLCVCVSVCVSNFSCEQNSSQTDAQIWTRFSLNGCFLHWLKPYWIWWPWVKGQGHSDVIPVLSS